MWIIHKQDDIRHERKLSAYENVDACIHKKKD